VSNLGHGRMVCGREVVGKVGVREGGVPAGGERPAVAKVAGVGLEEGLWAWAGDEAGPKIGVQESTAHELGTFKGGGRARGSGVGDRRKKSGVFEGKEGIRKARKGLANAREASGGEENIKTAVVVRGRVEGDDKLTGGVDGMGGKVVGSTMEAMVGGERPGSEVVEGELGL
jgi:hypothetical protein